MLRCASRPVIHAKAISAAVLLLLSLLAALVATSCAEPLRPTLEVTPTARTLVAGESVQLTVTRRFPGGGVEDVTALVSYASSDRALATVGARGEVTAGDEPGTVLIRVFDPTGDATAAVTFTVEPARIEVIEVTPSPALVMTTGAQRQFQAFARYNNGTSAEVTNQVLWTSTNLAAVTVGNTSADKGLVTAVAPGDANVIATDNVSGVQGRSIVFVTGPAPQLVAIVVTPNPGIVGVGQKAQFSALGVLGDGSTRDVTKDVTWSSSDLAVATVDQDGVVTGLAVGDTTVTATGPEPSTSVKGSAAARVVP